MTDLCESCAKGKDKDKKDSRIEQLEKLVMAVTCSPYLGITCEDIDGKNWFDLRGELLDP